MINLEEFDDIAKLAPTATNAEVITKVNDIIKHINAIVPALMGNED